MEIVSWEELGVRLLLLLGEELVTKDERLRDEESRLGKSNKDFARERNKSADSLLLPRDSDNGCAAGEDDGPSSDSIPT